LLLHILAAIEHEPELISGKNMGKCVKHISKFEVVKLPATKMFSLSSMHREHHSSESTLRYIKNGNPKVHFGSFSIVFLNAEN
jgi:hypothetical protein